jgi:hypothetical protein
MSKLNLNPYLNLPQAGLFFGGGGKAIEQTSISAGPASNLMCLNLQADFPLSGPASKHNDPFQPASRGQFDVFRLVPMLRAVISTSHHVSFFSSFRPQAL